MRLCFVIQRYGADVAGGAELHCRWLAERLGRRHEVRIETTCARDYVEWRNHYPAGRDEVAGLAVQRHPVERPRDERVFAKLSTLVFDEEHTLADERSWVVENGPVCPELVDGLAAMRDVDLFLFYSYRYYQSFFGLPRVAERAVLVPTAEEDPAVRLPVFAPLLRAPRGIVYLTPEEQQLIQGVSGNGAVPSVVVGSGINVPEGWRGIDVRSRFHLPPSFLLYIGRIDRNKGVDRLFDYYRWLEAEWVGLPPLVLVGTPVLPIPRHPKILHLGFVTEEEKFALLAAADLLLMPSPYESLSIAAALRVLMGRPELRARLGAAGQAYVRREYDWDVVERRVESFLEGLRGRA
jgi:glycosyltransferase involved in cell wall biosynthesis